MEAFEAPRPGHSTPARVLAFDGNERRDLVDELATEEPLEIRVLSGRNVQTAAVTMRTPGNDFELAAGFLHAEGILNAREELSGISYCVDPAVESEQRYNIVNVALTPNDSRPLERLERHFTMNSACGVCGKASIEALQTRAQRIEDPVRVDLPLIGELPRKMREAQRIFTSTGGLHAAALFDRRGELLVLREDVGRHNALDKIVGWALLEQKLPLRGCVLLLSGRASYELIQKSVVAGIPIVCAVSAPSSLAVSLANEFGVTLVGFVRERRANVYAGSQRIALSQEAP